MDGRTFDVTHCLNLFAEASFADKIREYSPDSLIMVWFLAWTCGSDLELQLIMRLSSHETWSHMHLLILQYPSIVATSLPRNQIFCFASRNEVSSIFISSLVYFFSILLTIYIGYIIFARPEVPFWHIRPGASFWHPQQNFLISLFVEAIHRPRFMDACSLLFLPLFLRFKDRT